MALTTKPRIAHKAILNIETNCSINFEFLEQVFVKSIELVKDYPGEEEYLKTWIFPLEDLTVFLDRYVRSYYVYLYEIYSENSYFAVFPKEKLTAKGYISSETDHNLCGLIEIPILSFIMQSDCYKNSPEVKKYIHNYIINKFEGKVETHNKWNGRK